MRTCQRTYPLALAIVCQLAAVPAFGDCAAEPAATVVLEQERIRQCLGEVARHPNHQPDGHATGAAWPGYLERLLFTWGPEVKIRRMETDKSFCHYEYERQREFEAIPWLQSSPAPGAAWYGTRSYTSEDGAGIPVRRVSRIGRLSDPAMRRALALQFAIDDFYSRSTARDRRSEVIALANDPDEVLTPARKSAAEGMRTAHEMREAGDMRSSSIKDGLGVYFSTDPFNYYEKSRPVGFVCRTPAQPVIIDPYYRRQPDDMTSADYLVSRNIYLGPDDPKPPILIVEGIENPVLYDRAARGQFITMHRQSIGGGTGRTSAYTDKCTLPYWNETVCRRMSIAEEWLSCEDFARLVGFQRASDGRIVKHEAAAGGQNLADDLFGAFAQSRAFAHLLPLRFISCFGTQLTEDHRAIYKDTPRAVLFEGIPASE